MSWAPGDLAECVDVRDLRLPLRNVALGGRYLKLGMVYIVQAVGASRARDLQLDVGAPRGPKLACRFRKVPPLREDQVEFVGADVPAGAVPA